MIKRCLLLVALVTLSANAAHAQLTGPTYRAQHWDFAIQTRYAGEQNRNGNGVADAAIESDLGWGFGFGYNANERVNVGFILSWRSANYTATVVPENESEDSQVYSSWLDTATMALSADWNILPKRFTPYISGALGWSFIDTNIPADVYGGCWWDPWYGYVCASDIATFGTNAFTYSIGVGARLELSEMLFIRVGYDYNGIDLEDTDGLDVFRLDVGFNLN